MKKKFVAFGCKNINSTHSFIHYAYQRAFESLGWDSYWIDNPDADTFDFRDSLILTLGGWDQKVPIRSDCKYILHLLYRILAPTNSTLLTKLPSSISNLVSPSLISCHRCPFDLMSILKEDKKAMINEIKNTII